MVAVKEALLEVLVVCTLQKRQTADHGPRMTDLFNIAVSYTTGTSCTTSTDGSADALEASSVTGGARAYIIILIHLIRYHHQVVSSYVSYIPPQQHV
eukprot:6940652-Pyramimonas_sp.AAC.1